MSTMTEQEEDEEFPFLLKIHQLTGCSRDVCSKLAYYIQSTHFNETTKLHIVSILLHTAGIQDIEHQTKIIQELHSFLYPRFSQIQTQTVITQSEV